MGKDFLNLKTDQKKICVMILFAGSLLTVFLAVRAMEDTKLLNDYELLKNESGEGTYDQKLIAFMEDEKIPVTIEVAERKFTKEEAQEMLTAAEKMLGDVLKAGNESLSKITTDIYFADEILQNMVEVEWTEKLPEYFYSDGTFREDLEIFEPLEQKVSAILSCQQYTRDYEAILTILPRMPDMAQKFAGQIEKLSKEDAENSVIKLPAEYEGKHIIWRKPLDITFLYVGLLTITAVFFLKAGSKRDKNLQKKERMEALEKDYAQIVSKFAMLLSAGLSVRNAWERIVLLNKEKSEKNHPIYIEMRWAVRQMQQGVPELDVYEKFGIRVGQIHYKKLMALLITDKKRGSINLLDAMNQEMLEAFQEQKRKTRQQGEKTGTKLLVPMMGMLAVVFIMILVPAFLSFQL